MRICIDSCVLIRGLFQEDPDAVRLLDQIGPDLVLMIPRLIVQEVTRNLRTPEQVRLFYLIFQQSNFAFIVEEPVPRHLVEKYIGMGLREKADAFIGAFAEWMQVRYLLSDNRHFLRDLHAEAYEVLDATEFIKRWEIDIL